MNDKIIKFAQLLEAETIQRLKDQNLGCDGNIAHARTHVKFGKKFAKVDDKTSGRFMVELSTGNIFGIKGYGQVHRGHFYGTLDTTGEYFWGGYHPVRKDSPTMVNVLGTPKLTFAPQT